MTVPDERRPDLNLRAVRARAESTRLCADAWRGQRQAAQLVISARRLVGESLVLLLEGALDMASAPAVADELATWRAPGEAVQIDRAGVDFIDAYSLRVLLDLTSTDGASGHVVLRRPSEAVTRLAELTGTAESLGLG